MEFICPDVNCVIPRTSIWSVWEVCEEYHLYSMPGVEEMAPPTVLDIGANCGMFALHAIWKFGPKCQVLAFEPNPKTFEMLKHNVYGLPVECHNLAVVPTADTPNVLFEGKYNALTCSLVDQGSQNTSKGTEVSTYLAAELPPCDILKIDIEGLETGVLAAYRHLDKVKYLLVEASFGPDAKRINEIATKAGLTFIDLRNSVLRFSRGV